MGRYSGRAYHRFFYFLKRMQMKREWYAAEWQAQHEAEITRLAEEYEHENLGYHDR
jgi:hypothetical protein